MSKPISTGLLSFGMSGRIFHAPFIHYHQGFVLRAVLERHDKKAAKSYPEVISYDSLDDIMDDQDIELLIINTPNDLHFEHARLALRAGKHVLVEKPASVTVKQLEELFALAENQHRHLMVYQNRRWDSDFQSVKQIVESKRLGSLIEAHFRYDRYKLSLGTKSFKETSEIPGSGLLYDLGPHLLDQVISLFGKPLDSHKVTAAHRPGSAVPDYFSIQLSFPGELNVYVTGSLLTAEPQAAFILHGTKGSYIKNRSDVQEFQLINHTGPGNEEYGREHEGMKGRLTIIEGDVKKITDQPTEIKGNYPGIYDAVFQTITNNEPFPVTKEQLVLQIELLEN